MSNVVKKNAEGYGYAYTDIAEIHRFLEQNNMSYYQYIERIDNDDYIMTVKIIDNIEQAPLRGCRVVQATLSGIKNPAQEQGSALTYARRYSLLMAFGLATEDDDAGSLTQTIDTYEDAINYKITFGKHNGKTLGQIQEEDRKYLNFLYDKGDDNIKKCLNIMLDHKQGG
ncbi:MAG: ERF family protein [Clostridia bacterium]|nr:ERF family protein [Clostridia bacterium]